MSCLSYRGFSEVVGTNQACRTDGSDPQSSKTRPTSRERALKIINSLRDARSQFAVNYPTITYNNTAQTTKRNLTRSVKKTKSLATDPDMREGQKRKQE